MDLEKISLANDAEYRDKSARLAELKSARWGHKQRAEALREELSRVSGEADDVESADAHRLAFGDGGGTATAVRTRADVRSEIAEADKALGTTESAIKLLDREVGAVRTRVSQRLCAGELAGPHKQLVRDAALALKAFDDAVVKLKGFYETLEHADIQWVGILPGAPYFTGPQWGLGSVHRPHEETWPLPRARAECIKHGIIKAGEWPAKEK
jgi:hypothetical protein